MKNDDAILTKDDIESLKQAEIDLRFGRTKRLNILHNSDLVCQIIESEENIRLGKIKKFGY